MAERAAAEAQLAAAERRQADGAPATRAAAAQEEMDRLAVSAEQARERAELAQAEYDQVQELGGVPEEDRSELAAAHQQAADAWSELSERTVVRRTAERESARELAARRARAETLAEAARRGADASAAVLADPDRF